MIPSLPHPCVTDKPSALELSLIERANLLSITFYFLLLKSQWTFTCSRPV